MITLLLEDWVRWAWPSRDVELAGGLLAELLEIRGLAHLIGPL